MSVSFTSNATSATSLFNTPTLKANNTSATVAGISTGMTSAESAMLGTVGTIMMNASTGQAVIAAQEASNRANATTNVSIRDGQPTKSAANVATQVSVTLSGATPGSWP